VLIISASLEPDIGGRARNAMSKKIIYTDAPDDISEAITSGERVIDFLPPPDQLAKKPPKVKITISLNQQSVEFFKKSAKKNKMKYQSMINEILDQYVKKFSNNDNSQTGSDPVS